MLPGLACFPLFLWIQAFIQSLRESGDHACFLLLPLLFPCPFSSFLLLLLFSKSCSLLLLYTQGLAQCLTIEVTQ